MRSNNFRDYLSQIYRDKILGWILLNHHIKKISYGMERNMLDLGGVSPSYLKYLSLNLYRTTRDLSSNPPIDMNNKLPFGDAYFDSVFIMNALYTVKKGFRSIAISRLSGRLSAAINILHSFFVFDTLRLFVDTFEIWGDILTARFQERHRVPITYLVDAIK